MIKYTILLFTSFFGIVVLELWNPEVTEDQKIIAIRSVGHQLLLHTGDTTTNLQPVVKTKSLSFQLKFTNTFTFSSDTLIDIIHHTFSKANIGENYMVKVLDCENFDFMYGYEITDIFDLSSIPCTGREQPRGCYVVDISFQKKSILSALSANYLTRPTLLVLLLFSVFSFVQHKRKNNNRSNAEDKTSIEIGVYRFLPIQNVLQSKKSEINLSAKETKLLNILSDNLNQTVKREHIMEYVWEDVIVGRSLDVYISKLRKYLKEDPNVKIVNAHGEGYKLEVSN